MSLEYYRTQIDTIDQRIVALIEQRMKCSQRIGVIKATHDLPIEHTQRESSILSSLHSHSILDPEMLDALYKTIFTFSKSRQDV
jgi:chorismate mutase